MRLKNDELFAPNSIDGPGPQVLFGVDGVDGTKDPWRMAELGTLYVRTSPGYVDVWQKFADSGATTDWRNTMGGIAQTYELTLQNAATATGNGTVASAVGGYGTVLVNVYGTFSGTITFEGSRDGTNYYALLASNNTTGAKATTATAAGLYQINFAGLSYFRARVSTYASGSVTAKATFVASDAGSILTGAASVTVSSGTVAVSSVAGQEGGYADNDTFTRGTSRLMAGLAGIYESTISTLTAGKVALARLSNRGAQITVPDMRLDRILAASINAAPYTDASGIIVINGHTGLLGSTDGSTYGLQTDIYIPLQTGGMYWSKCGVTLGFAPATWDQAVTISVYGMHDAATFQLSTILGKYATFVLTAATANLIIAMGDGTLATGGVAGVDPAVANAYYAFTVSQGTPYLMIRQTATVAPTAGILSSISVRRSN